MPAVLVNPSDSLPKNSNGQSVQTAKAIGANDVNQVPLSEAPQPGTYWIHDVQRP
jgi:hypothetical protein